MEGYDGDVYAHTGVITDESSGPSDWKYVKTGWGENTPDTLRFWVELSGLDSDELYRLQYYIDGELMVSDPCSELILDPWNDQYISEETFPDMPEYPTGKGDGMVSTFQVNKDEYQWQVENFDRHPGIPEVYGR